MGYRKVDFIVWFLICFILNVNSFSDIFNIKDMSAIILGSCIFAATFGMLTNFIFKKRK